MTINFDTLSFAKRLTEAGEKGEVAEAHAFAIKDLVMSDLVTREDLRQALELQTYKLTVRFGFMIVVAVGVIATLDKLL